MVLFCIIFYADFLSSQIFNFRNWFRELLALEQTYQFLKKWISNILLRQFLCSSSESSRSFGFSPWIRTKLRERSGKEHINCRSSISNYKKIILTTEEIRYWHAVKQAKMKGKNFSKFFEFKVQPICFDININFFLYEKNIRI